MAPSRGDTWLVSVGLGIVKHVTNGPLAVAMELSGWKAFPTQVAAEKYAHEDTATQIAGAVTSPVTSAIQATGLNDLASRFTSKNLWIRVGEVLAGLSLFGIGAVFLVKNSQTMKSATNTVKDAAGTARLIK